MKKLFVVGSLVLALVRMDGSPVPKNLANGLDKLVESNLVLQGKLPAPVLRNAKRANGSKVVVKGQPAIPTFDGYATKEAAQSAANAIVDSASGRFMVDIVPNGQVPFQTLLARLKNQFSRLTVKTTDPNYKGHGLIEGSISVDDVAAMSAFKGIGSIVLQLQPIHNVGNVTEYGLHLHRVNHVDTLYNSAVPPAKNFDGTGISIGVMSDSYDSQPSEEGGDTSATQDVATQDLPGLAAGVNPNPVVVLEDYKPTPGATNEGRAMCQIVADMVPKATIGFATADTGELGFANNIRALAGLPGFTKDPSIQLGFKADVVCDDVSYLDEPMFSDGIIAQGVNDVVAHGVSYCSSAANNWGTDGYASVFRPVPNTAAALNGTNIDLTGVDPSLYAGGFHNFNPNPGQQDIAQLINTQSDSQAFVFQWNDPYDTSTPALIQPPTFTGNGNSTLASPSMDFHPPAFIAGHAYVITEVGDKNPPNNFDAIVAVIDPNGNTIVDQDTGVDETVTFFAPIGGNYIIRVHPFETPVAGGFSVQTMGPYTVTVNEATGTLGITQDFNLLFFDTSGKFISALATNNFANNRPYELAQTTFNADGFDQVQMVICRSNKKAPKNAANQLKYVFFGNGVSGVGPAEYNDYLTPVTFGHSAAAGANSVAAYACFRPNIPEDFTSPGPVAIYFDANNKRLKTPEIRQKPDVAAADGSNNTFFPIGPVFDVTESTFDADQNYPNFYGTSAASPHAAALAGMVIESHGGSGHISPADVKTILQLTAFPHDLDPYFSGGSATAANGGKVDIGIVSDSSDNPNTGNQDPNVFRVSYTGPGYVASLHFNPEGTDVTGGDVTGGNFNGNASGNMPEQFLDPTFYKYTPGMVWLTAAGDFLFGDSTGVAAGDVTHSYSNPAPFPSNPSPGNPTAQEWTLNFTFAPNSFTAGDVFRFNNSRSPQQDATVPQGMTITVLARMGDFSADMLGSGVLLPEFADNPVVPPGMTFNGTIVDGANTIPFSGRLNNVIGKGYSVLDGYGFINAQAATMAVLPTAGVVSRKTHGSKGSFDIPLPSTGPAGIECRDGGATHDFTLVFTFNKTVNALNSAPAASFTQGTGSVSGIMAGPDANQVTVSLTGVTNAQTIKVRLSGLRNNSNQAIAATTATMAVLLGDTTANRRVNDSDVSQTKSQSGHALTSSNFREDVTVNGLINDSDVSAVKAQSGTGL